MSLLDLPLEKQKECADRRGMTMDEWVKHQRESDERMRNHQITGYMDAETSARFEAKMLSGTPTS